jgi:tRNA-specific 2-thiouridylase
VLGRHEGIHRFTIGQRKGLGLSSPIPLYVVGIDPETAAVTVGPREALERRTLTASRVNWMSGNVPAGPIRAHARIRYRHREAPATIVPAGDDRISVTFDAPQSAVTPGQAIVFYDGPVVVGGGWID